MGAERKVMQEYLDALVKRADYPVYFSDDVVATFEGTDQRAVGREAAGQLIRYVHEGAFDARPELKNLLVDDGKAAIEADFVGTHTAVERVEGGRRLLAQRVAVALDRSRVRALVGRELVERAELGANL